MHNSYCAFTLSKQQGKVEPYQTIDFILLVSDKTFLELSVLVKIDLNL